MRSRRPAASLGAVLLLGTAPLGGQSGPLTLSGGATVVGQTADHDLVRSEVIGSLDLFAELSLGGPSLFMYAEGSTTPFARGVSRRVAIANTDAGSAVDGSGRGRMQISELRLVMPLGSRFRSHVGLLDATGFLDVSRIANDENLFFLGAPFVNNPTIEFADYAVGAALQGTVLGSLPVEVGLVVSASHGLADNPDRSYGELVDLAAPGRGVFSGATVRWEGEGLRASVGGWLRSQSLVVGGGSSGGAFSVIGWAGGAHSLSARGGLSNSRAAPARGYLGLTYLLADDERAMGAAFGRAFEAVAAPATEDLTQGELFLRRRLARSVFATLSLQSIRNVALAEDPGAIVARDLWIGGVRLSAAF